MKLNSKIGEAIYFRRVVCFLKTSTRNIVTSFLKNTGNKMLIKYILLCDWEP